MTDNTPPAWAINAARAIVGFWTTASALPLSVREQKTATVISNFAPDAEALALALESALQTIKFEKHPYRPWHSQAKDALAAYRAQHPKG